MTPDKKLIEQATPFDILQGVLDDLSDEGDRVYLGSTNDVDTLKRLAASLEALSSPLVGREMIGQDQGQVGLHWRKKPVVIEAVQLTWKTWSDICEHLGAVISDRNPARSVDTFSDACGETAPFIELTIPTLEGEHIAKHGDWIIKGVKGEFYPCKPDIFAATYEPAEAISKSTGAA